jgi:hypothetical protein
MEIYGRNLKSEKLKNSEKSKKVENIEVKEVKEVSEPPTLQAPKGRCSVTGS